MGISLLPNRKMATKCAFDLHIIIIPLPSHIHILLAGNPNSMVNMMN